MCLKKFIKVGKWFPSRLLRLIEKGIPRLLDAVDNIIRVSGYLAIQRGDSRYRWFPLVFEPRICLFAPCLEVTPKHVPPCIDTISALTLLQLEI